jgi:hypothetical protein
LTLRKERDTYKKARKELLETEWGASTSQPVYDMPPAYDHSMTERPVEKVSTLKSFLKSCLELMKDETALNMLHVDDRPVHTR